MEKVEGGSLHREFLKVLRGYRREQAYVNFTLKSDDAASTGLILIEQCAEAFKRDIPLNIKASIRNHQAIYDSHYSADLNPGGFAEWILKLQRAFELGNTVDFYAAFFPAVDQLDDTYLEMLKYRKEIFDFDTSKDYGCTFDRLLLSPDDKVCWEEELQPCRYPLEERAYYQEVDANEDDTKDNNSDEDSENATTSLSEELVGTVHLTGSETEIEEQISTLYDGNETGNSSGSSSIKNFTPMLAGNLNGGQEEEYQALADSESKNEL